MVADPVSLLNLGVGCLALLVIPLTGWAFRLQLRNAALEARVTSLEGFRKDDRAALDRYAQGQNEILVHLEGIKSDLKHLMRAGGAA